MGRFLSENEASAKREDPGPDASSPAVSECRMADCGSGFDASRAREDSPGASRTASFNVTMMSQLPWKIKLSA